MFGHMLIRHHHNVQPIAHRRGVAVLPLELEHFHDVPPREAWVDEFSPTEVRLQRPKQEKVGCGAWCC